jgi:Tol biopolymer transport system component
MGEVYRGRDTRLAREVALKILPDAFASDPDRLLRFEREAKTLASLNHPRIAQIYGFEQSALHEGRSSISALAMEFVDGEDLAARLSRGRIPVDEALAIARQIADALAAAHAAGVVHRDLKPANVKVRSDGTVKVLDFGLAKPTEKELGIGASGSINPADSPTITSPLTLHGMILGTAAYMAPEQAKGRPVDHRADVWAFGCVLYEMLTGERLFEGHSVTETLAEVLKKDVDYSRLPADTPHGVRRLLRRCLQRDPDRRLHAIADARLELEDDDDEVSTAVAPAPKRTARWLLAAACALAGLAIGGGAMWLARPADRIPDRVRSFTIAGAGFNFSGTAAISRDGRWLAYSPDAEAPPFKLFVRSLDSVDARQVAASNDTGLNPFFSPDGRWVAFFANATLYKAPVSGGEPQVIAPTPGPEFRQGAWAADGTIVVSTGITPGVSDGMWKLAPGATTLTRLTDDGDRDAHFAPEILPDGRTVLFTLRTTESVSIAAVPLDGGEIKTVLSGVRSPRYVSSGQLFFQRLGSDDLFVTRFDPAALSATGEPLRVATIAWVNELAAYAVADDGTLIYSAPGETAEQTRYSIVSVDREGQERVLLDEAGGYAQPRVSPDGRFILYRVIAQPFCDLWTLDLTRGTRTRVTFEGDNHDPIWEPNSRDITWNSQLPTGFELRSGPIDRSRPVRTLLKGSEMLAPGAWTRDRRMLAYVESESSGGLAARPSATASAINLFDAERGGSHPFVKTRFQERHPAFSPDGRWIAWVSNETGRDEVYIKHVTGGEGRLQISTDGGMSPVWSPDGRELFYGAGSQLMSVTMKLGATAQASRPRRVLEGPYTWERPENYDIMPDGRAFVFIKRAGNVGSAAVLRVVLNWSQLTGGGR